MQSWRDHWRAIVVFAALVFFLAYLVVWTKRAQCGVTQPFACFVQVHMRYLANFISMDWVHEYQTLVAGIFATVGASTAFISVYLQRQWQIDADRRAARTRKLEVFNWTALQFRGLAERLMNSELDMAIQEAEQITLRLPALASVSAGIADLMRVAVSMVQYRIRNPGTRVLIVSEDGDAIEVSNREYAAVFANLISGFFSHPERLLTPEGEVKFLPQSGKIARTVVQYTVPRVDFRRLPLMDLLYERHD